MDLHDALTQVRQMRNALQERRQFRGYSGRARLLGGGLALACAFVLASPATAKPQAHFLAWLIVLVMALAANYGALLLWFFSRDGAGRDRSVVRPAYDALAPLALGGLLTLALARAGAYDLLFGTWMCCYGLAHLPYRLTLPRLNYLVGLGYLAAGAACLVAPGAGILNPWPMGVVFFIGETCGGFALIQDDRRYEQELRHAHEKSDIES
ncbi:MAG: hypothetical protein NTY53_11815 [Kiritimatiellaeota bacterium]|nr:hypothetical protein [Kiritimatiellota bacterium]